MKKSLLVFLVTLLSGIEGAEIVTKEIIYKIDTMTFKGLLAHKNKSTGKHPGILVVHEWWGLNDFTKTQTKRLAALGFIAFAIDMYGDGKTTTDPQAASKMSGEIRGTPKMRERVLAGFQTLLKQEFVDPKRTAAIGFCFGGTTVLELAYSGANVKGVVSFHGSIISPKQEELGNIKAKFLILHGADDPNISRDTIVRFQESLDKAHADWQMIYYGNAVHSFTNPAAGTDKNKGSAYDTLAAQRSWKHMQMFFKEIL